MNNFGYLTVTDHVKANSGEDVSDALQQLIADNPSRTLFFPDGEYMISKPICTPADPRKSVMLMLSNYAVIKAAEGWDSEEAMVRIGGIEPFNSIDINGSNYGICGGIIDGSGVAKGISVDSGRESRIEKLSIKHTSVGIHIKRGVNSGSSDVDVVDVNIVGNDKIGSVGVLIEGCDNTLTNMRIASVQIGVKAFAGPQFMKNLHPLYIFRDELADEEAYKNSYGFWDNTVHHNWYQNCYSDQFATGFRIRGGGRTTYSDCFCYWYTPKGGKQHGFHCEGKFQGVIRTSNINVKPDATDTAYIVVDEEGGKGKIYDPYMVESRIMNKTYKDYLVGDVLDTIE